MLYDGIPEIIFMLEDALGWFITPNKGMYAPLFYLLPSCFALGISFISLFSDLSPLLQADVLLRDVVKDT
jgi:hypothetical protein